MTDTKTSAIQTISDLQVRGVISQEVATAAINAVLNSDPHSKVHLLARRAQAEHHIGTLRAKISRARTGHSRTSMRQRLAAFEADLAEINAELGSE